MEAGMIVSHIYMIDGHKPRKTYLAAFRAMVKNRIQRKITQ